LSEMICWYCYWGWSEQVAAVYTKALAALDGYESPLEFGPAHVVWSDENFDCAERMLEEFDSCKSELCSSDLAIVRQSLVELAAIPMDVRCPEPEDYDGEHPELYPPKEGVVMVKCA